MGVSLIGVLLVLRLEAVDPSFLRTGHFPSRYRTPLLRVPHDVLSASVIRWPQAGA